MMADQRRAMTGDHTVAPVNVSFWLKKQCFVISLIRHQLAQLRRQKAFLCE